MSAYQDLMTALVTRRPDQSAAEDERIVLTALDKHAHELAAKQRAWAQERYDAAPPELDHAGLLAIQQAADLIDPKVGR